MNQDYTHISIVLDRSGSMSTVVDDTIGGFNTFLEDQKKEKGKATLSLIQFDDKYEVVHRGKDIQQIQKLDHSTFVPRGMTALNDAVGKCIVETGEFLKDMKEEDRPAKIIFVIQTDGKENSSHEYTYEKIKEMIRHQEENYNWKFVFLGAGLDAAKQAKSMGIITANTINYANTGAGNSALYASVSSNVTKLRNADVTDYTYMNFFEVSDYEKQDKIKTGSGK